MEKKKKKKPAKKKKKSGNLMKRAQKNFERDPTKKIFWSSETLRERKQKIMNKVRDLINPFSAQTTKRLFKGGVCNNNVFNAKESL